MEIHLGENIKRLRKESRLTQEQLAEALGVTTGAVHKWESGKATPELTMLVDIAAFFETSVDALLHYGWEKLSMGQAAQKLGQYTINRQFQEGMQFAEKALLKFPNSFQVVFFSARMYFLTQEKAHMPKAISLFEKALSLIEQNTDPEIGQATIQNFIARCLCYMEQVDDALVIFKKNNEEGRNNLLIGLSLTEYKGRESEALPYLSDALMLCYSQLYNLGVGFTNAYSAQKDWIRITDFILWLQQLGEGLRNTAVVNWMDKGNVNLYLILAQIEAYQNNNKQAEHWLRKAKESAAKYDSAPDSRLSSGIKYYHGNEITPTFDNLGETAMDIIQTTLSSEEGSILLPIWERISADGSCQLSVAPCFSN